MERLESCLCILSSRPVAVTWQASAVPRGVAVGFRYEGVIRAKPGADLRVASEGVEDAGREGVGSDDPAGDKAIQCGLDRKLVAAHPPVRNSPGGVHGGLVFEQEEDNLLGKWVRV